jgi:hypothetical protein
MWIHDEMAARVEVADRIERLRRAAAHEHAARVAAAGRPARRWWGWAARAPLASVARPALAVLPDEPTRRRPAA